MLDMDMFDHVAAALGHLAVLAAALGPEILQNIFCIEIVEIKVMGMGTREVLIKSIF